MFYSHLPRRGAQKQAAIATFSLDTSFDGAKEVTDPRVRLPDNKTVATATLLAKIKKIPMD